MGIIQEAKNYLKKADMLDKLKIYMDYYIDYSYMLVNIEFVNKDYIIPKGYEDRIDKYDSCIIKYMKSNRMSFDKFLNENYIEDHLWKFYKRIGVKLNVKKKKN